MGLWWDINFNPWPYHTCSSANRVLMCFVRDKRFIPFRNLCRSCGINLYVMSILCTLQDKLVQDQSAIPKYIQEITLFSLCYPKVEHAYGKKTVAIFSCMQTLMTQSDKKCNTLNIILAFSQGDLHFFFKVATWLNSFS